MQAQTGRRNVRLKGFALLVALACLFAGVDLLTKSLVFGRLAQATVTCPACAADVRVPGVRDFRTACPRCGQRFLVGQTEIEGAELVLIPRVLSFQLALNPGGLFGMGANHTELFVLFSVATMGLVVWMFFSFGHSHWIPALALALVLGGALGNLWDRIVYQRVRDFVLVYIGAYRWPNFNVADMWICIGVGALVVWLWMNPDATASDSVDEQTDADTSSAKRRKRRNRSTGKSRS